MKECREDRDGGWRIGAPLIGSITISHSIVLCALVVGIVLFSACDEMTGPSTYDLNVENTDAAYGQMYGDIFNGVPPEEARKAARNKYGNENVDAALRRIGGTPPDRAATTLAADTAPKPEASPAGAATPEVKFYSELPPDDGVVTVTHGSLPPEWSPD